LRWQGSTAHTSPPSPILGAHRAEGPDNVDHEDDGPHLGRAVEVAEDVVEVAVGAVVYLDRVVGKQVADPGQVKEGEDDLRGDVQAEVDGQVGEALAGRGPGRARDGLRVRDNGPSRPPGATASGIGGVPGGLGRGRWWKLGGKDATPDEVERRNAALGELVDFDRYPALQRALRGGAQPYAADQFEFGLQRLLDGVAALIRSRRPTAPAES
jgi:hypothetical protein